MHYKYTVMQYVGETTLQGDVEYKQVGEYDTLKAACTALNKINTITYNEVQLCGDINRHEFTIDFGSIPDYIRVERIGKLPVEVEMDNLFGSEEYI